MNGSSDFVNKIVESRITGLFSRIRVEPANAVRYADLKVSGGRPFSDHLSKIRKFCASKFKLCLNLT